MSNEYTVGNLFAGGGGLSKAFQQAGTKIVWANEIDKNACNLYRENFSSVCLIEGNIKEVETEKIPSIDILIGGLPSKSFSILEQKIKANDERRNLFFEILRILKAKKPRAFLLESVKSLELNDNGKTFEIIAKSFQDEGYYIKSAVLNSMEYGNIPHNKKRLYIIGFRDEKEYSMFKFPEKVNLKIDIGDIIDFNNKKEDKYYYKEVSKYYLKLKKEVKRTDRVYQFVYQANREERYSIKEYSFCPNLTLITRTNYIPIINDNFNIRKFTPSECFHFQGYYDIKIPMKIRDNMLYKYAACCSSVTVVERIAKCIIKVLDSNGEFNHISDFVKFDKNDQENKDKIVEECEISVNEKVYANDKGGLHEDNMLNNILKEVENTEDKYKKGKVLESLMKLLFEQVDGFHVNTNVRTKTEEIDIFIRNESKSEFWKKESIFIIGECKNWTKKAGKNELIVFRSKIENRRDRVKLGFFISWNGFTNTYTSEDLRGSKGDILIIPVTGHQIKECIINGKIESYLKKWYQKAVVL